MNKLITFVLLFFLFSFGQKAVIVVNPAIKDIKREDIKDILLGMKRNKVILSRDRG